MKNQLARWGMAVATALALAGCGGGGDGTSTPPVNPSPTTIKDTINAAAAVAANDTSTNSTSAFTVLQGGGLPAVVVKSPPKVNFTVFSDGGVVKTLTTSNVRFIIAKLVPGVDGNPDQWQSYTHRTETATAGVGPGGVPVLPSAKQATTDSSTSTQLVYNTDGYYTYTFSTDITDPTKTNGVVFEPGMTHRVAIQLSYNNAAGETIRVNPYFDFTVDSNGNSVSVTDPGKTRVMADISSCNSCHERLGLHGGGRMDVQYCVMCHNPGTTDANSGQVLTMATMVHKIHAGRLLKAKLDSNEGGEDYVIWGYRDSAHDYAHVGFPQDLRNCTKCHDGSNPKTPQGDNWKTKISKESCLSCHANKAGSTWDTSHKIFAGTLVGAGAQARDLTNKQCVDCHKPGTNIAPERVHWNQNEENAARYKMNIESVNLLQVPTDTLDGKVEVKYSLSDPTNGNARYKLESDSTRFGSLRLYVAYQNLVGQSTAVTEFSAYNNGGSSTRFDAINGTNDGSDRYTAVMTIPKNIPGIALAAGTARIITIGQIREPKLQVKSATDPRPPVVPAETVNTIAQHTYKDFALSGPLNVRREIVSNDKCNACHGALGTTSGSNTLANAFHGGARNTVEACQLCHDATRSSSSTRMTNGLDLRESYQFKRMIHGIHGNFARTYPFTHGNTVVDAFNKDGTSKTGGAPLASNVENYAAEVAWPGTTGSGIGFNCNACHVNDSYKRDLGPLGSVVSPRVSGADPRDYFVISPKAASCTSCHDSANAISHVTSFPGGTSNSSFGNLTQAQTLLRQESCEDCHASGAFKGVDLVHGLK